MAVVLIAIVAFILGLFTLITGWGIPRLKGRWTGLCIALIAGAFMITASMEYGDEREARWAQLRTTDPDTYLAELAVLYDERWLKELEELRPEAFKAELDKRQQVADELNQRLVVEARETAAVEKAAEEARADVGVENSAVGVMKAPLTQADFYWDEDTNRYRTEIVRIVNRIATDNRKCPVPDPQSVMLSKSRSKSGAPVFFVTCGSGPNVFNIWFSPNDAAKDRDFRATEPLSRSAAANACEEEARARAPHPSTVEFSRFIDLAYTEYESGRARVTSRFTAKNGFNLELAHAIECLFEGDRLIEVNIREG